MVYVCAVHGPCAIVTPLHLARYKVVRMSSNDECGNAPSQEVVVDKRASHPAASDAIPISVVGHGGCCVCALDLDSVASIHRRALAS